MKNGGTPCPFCGEGTLTRQVKQEHFEYKGHTKTVDDYISYVCSSCGDELVDANDNHDIEAEFVNFRCEVDGLLTPSEICNIRKRLGFTQADFAEVLQVGKKSFARYETGAVTQGRSMDNLLRLLKDFPLAIHSLGKTEHEPPQRKSKGNVTHLYTVTTGPTQHPTTSPRNRDSIRSNTRIQHKACANG